MTEQIVSTLIEGYENAGWFGLVSALVMVSVRVYRLDYIQANLPQRFQWGSWSPLAQKAAVFASALAGSLILSLAGGIAFKAALIAAIPVALGSIGLHKGTKALGHRLPVDREKLRLPGETGKDPEYVKSPFREAASVIVPLKAKRIAGYEGPK